MSDDTQNHIEMPDDASIRDAQHEKELAKRGIDTYEELAKYYKTLHREYVEEQIRQEGALNWGSSSFSDIPSYDKANLRNNKDLNTVKELKAEVKSLMSVRDDQTAGYQEIEAHYEKELADKGLDTYKELADKYKSLWADLNDDVFSDKGDFTRWAKKTDLKKLEHLDSPEELKRATVYLMKERDFRAELNERYGAEVDAYGAERYKEGYEGLAERYKEVYKEYYKGTPMENYWEGKDITRKDFPPKELELATMRLMWQRDKPWEPVPENHPAAPGGPAIPEVEPHDPPLPNFEESMPPVKIGPFTIGQKSETETPPDSDEQAFAAAGRGETQTSLDLLKDQFRQGGLLDEKDEQEEKEAPPVDKLEADASSVEPSQPLPPEVAEGAVTYDPNMDPDRPPEDDSGLRIGPETGRIDPDSVGQVGTDAIVGAEAVGEAGGPGETIEDAAGKAILDPPGARGDVVEPMDEPVGHSVVDGVENLAFVGEDEGAVDDMNDPVVEDVVDPWG